jgi:hypothetical protein
MKPFDLAVLTYTRDMYEILRAMDVAMPIVKKLEHQHKHFIDDFDAQVAMNLEGKHLIRAQDGSYIVEKFALKELLWSQADTHNVFGLYNEKTIIFNGKSYMGKSEFCAALAKEFAVRKNKQAFGWGTIDKYGAVTKASQMEMLGCFVFDDFSLSTRGGTHRLSTEEVKHFLYSKQRGTVNAFYGDAIFPEMVPRIWVVNYQHGGDTDFWFRREDSHGSCRGLIELQCENVDYFNSDQVDEEAIAVARRAIIFNVDKQLFKPDSAVNYQGDARRVAAAEEARGSPAPVGI